MTKIAAFVALGMLAAAPCRAQGIVSNYPPLSPAEAVAVLRGSHSIADYTDRHVVPTEDGPTVFVLGSSSTAGPYGEFQRFRPTRRLSHDSYVSDPYVLFYDARRPWLTASDVSRGLGRVPSRGDARVVSGADRPSRAAHQGTATRTDGSQAHRTSGRSGARPRP